MAFDVEKFDHLLLENGVLGFKDPPIKLKSGRQSHYYINCRVLTDTIRMKNILCAYILEHLSDISIDPDYFVGVPEGATKIALGLNDYRAQISGSARYMDAPWVLMRAKPKEHGDPRDRFFIGTVYKGDRVLLIEDVLTTGDSLIERIKQVSESSLNIVAAMALVNRLEKRSDGISAKEAVERTGVKCFWLTDSRNLIKKAIERFSPPQELLEKLQKEIDEYAVKPWKVLNESA